MPENKFQEISENLEKKSAAFRLKQRLFDINWSDKYQEFFGKFALLNQSPEQKETISLHVKDDGEIGIDYWVQIILATAIATFGLLQNSVAVIIGAMLISPLLNPLQATAYGIAEGRSKMFWQSIRVLILSCAVSIGTAWVITLFVGISTETSEIASRTSPNALDLFIAFASAIIAFLSLSFKKLSEGLAGVAMSTAILPPLAVSGIELYWGALDKAFGGFYLFLTNFVAVVFVGTIIFLLYGFGPHAQDFKQTLRKIGVFLLGFIVLWISLSSSLKQISEEITVKQKSQEILRIFFETQSPTISIENLKYSKRGKTTTLEINIYGSMDDLFTQEILQEVQTKVQKELKKKIRLIFNVIRIEKISG